MVALPGFAVVVAGLGAAASGLGVEAVVEAGRCGRLTGPSSITRVFGKPSAAEDEEVDGVDGRTVVAVPDAGLGAEPGTAAEPARAGRGTGRRTEPGTEPVAEPALEPVAVPGSAGLGTRVTVPDVVPKPVPVVPGTVRGDVVGLATPFASTVTVLRGTVVPATAAEVPEVLAEPVLNAALFAGCGLEGSSSVPFFTGTLRAPGVSSEAGGVEPGLKPSVWSGLGGARGRTTLPVLSTFWSGLVSSGAFGSMRFGRRSERISEARF